MMYKVTKNNREKKTIKFLDHDASKKWCNLYVKGPTKIKHDP
jgi:hypothetical protein